MLVDPVDLAFYSLTCPADALYLNLRPRAVKRKLREKVFRLEPA